MRFMYWVVRYVPNPVREEFVNVAVIAGSGNDWAMRRVSNLQRASRLGGTATVTTGFLERMSQAINGHLAEVEALFDAPAEQLTHGLLMDFETRMNGVIQLRAPRPIRADSADDAADLAFDLMVVDDGPAIRHRSRTLIARQAREAFAQDTYLAPHLVARSRQARVEDQRVDYDVAVANDAAVQLTQAWSFDLKNLSRLETNIQAWNYLINRIRKHGGELIRPRDRQAHPIEIPSNIDINVLYREPHSPEGRRQLGIALRGWDDLDIQAVPEGSVATLITEARHLVTA